MSERKEEGTSLDAPRGQRVEMKRVSEFVIMEISKQTKIKDVDICDYAKKREHIDYAMRKIIQNSGIATLTVPNTGQSSNLR